MSAKERFLKYVTIDTQSEENSGTYPSTAKQKDLLCLLVEELKALGLSDAAMDEHGYVTATLEACGADADAPVMGLIAHVDTSPDMSGAGVKPRELMYNGGDIVLNQEQNIVMRASDFPVLEGFKGKHLIVTDGTTLLGGDDKAGIAEIMGLLELYATDRSIRHPKIRVAFTPDEEVGAGTDFFDVKKFGADFAYTVDGGVLGEIEYENFNAASVFVTVKGRNIHPGSAKNKMLNSLLIFQEFNSMLPPTEIPSATENYEGFYHLNELSGNVEQTEAHYILRDHDAAAFAARKQRVEKICDYLNDKYGSGTVKAEITDSYYNMKEKILPHIHLVDNARKAMEACGVVPAVIPIRGGTDGARLSFEGLPCPNLCTGTANMHGRFEFTCSEDMQSIVSVLKELMSYYIHAPQK